MSQIAASSVSYYTFAIPLRPARCWGGPPDVADLDQHLRSPFSKAHTLAPSFLTFFGGTRRHCLSGISIALFLNPSRPTPTAPGTPVAGYAGYRRGPSCRPPSSSCQATHYRPKQARQQHDQAACRPTSPLWTVYSRSVSPAIRQAMASRGIAVARRRGGYAAGHRAV